jgi:hypothetical protein
MTRLEALNAVYDRLHDRIVVTIGLTTVARYRPRNLSLLENRFQFARSLRS